MRHLAVKTLEFEMLTFTSEIKNSNSLRENYNWKSFSESLKSRLNCPKMDRFGVLFKKHLEGNCWREYISSEAPEMVETCEDSIIEGD